MIGVQPHLRGVIDLLKWTRWIQLNISVDQPDAATVLPQPFTVPPTSAAGSRQQAMRKKCADGLTTSLTD